MRVVFFPGGPYASMAARVLPLAKGLCGFGIECEVIQPIRWGRGLGRISGVMSFLLPHPPADYARTLLVGPDVAIINDSCSYQMYGLVKLLQSRGTRVIFDLDDPVFLEVSRVLGHNTRPGSFALEPMLKTADHVTVNGHYLEHYVRQYAHEVTLIPDPIDTNLFQPRSDTQRGLITLGWEGVPRNHYGGLRTLVRPLSRLAMEFDFRLKIVSYLGDSNVLRLFQQLENQIDIDYGDEIYVPIGELANHVAEFDVMLAPLEKTPWYEGKSTGRTGLGMALGIPVVASPIGEQKYRIRNGFNGFLADTEEDWYVFLKTLLQDSELRKAIGTNGRRTAESELSQEVCARQLLQLVSQGIAR